MTSGVTACMFELIGVAPARYCRIFVMTREASATVAPGRRRPIELTQSTRFVRARIVVPIVGEANDILPGDHDRRPSYSVTTRSAGGCRPQVAFRVSTTSRDAS